MSHEADQPDLLVLGQVKRNPTGINPVKMKYHRNTITKTAFVLVFRFNRLTPPVAGIKFYCLMTGAYMYVIM